MAVTTTHSFDLPTKGGDTTTWGDKLNANWGKVDDLLDGTLPLANIDINGGTVDGTPVGATTPGAGTFTGLEAATFTIGGVSVAPVFLVPAGGIIMWSGAVSAIPTGWVICDGANSTPDLTGRFVIHADSDAAGTYNVDDTGGAATVALAEGDLPAHTHAAGDIVTASAGAHTHDIAFTFASREVNPDASTVSNVGSGPSSGSTESAGAHTHTMSGNSASTGSGTAHDNLPPYYALAYIMKTA
jgi:microcystin-dependent protein